MMNNLFLVYVGMSMLALQNLIILIQNDAILTAMGIK